MFLKSLDMYAFKSFAEKTHIDFSDGITCLVGPNGCGKSNIVDAIRWVLGEQSSKSLRADSMQDVIFAGTETRKSVNYASVTLLISNEDGLLKTGTNEVEIKRRLFRTGESEYYINRQPVMLKDVRNLLMDTGVGKTAYSFLEQGKIDRILSTRPEDRRYVFEEAAGISKFKSEMAEAGSRLEKTESNIREVTILLDEITRDYNRLKAQSDKALQYRKLSEEQFTLEVDLVLCELDSFEKMQTGMDGEIARKKAEFDGFEAEYKLVSENIGRQRTLLEELKSKKNGLLLLIEKEGEGISGLNAHESLLSERLNDFDVRLRAEDDKLASLGEEIAELDERAGKEKQVCEECLAGIKECVKKSSEGLRGISESKAAIEKNSKSIEENEAKSAELTQNADKIAAELNKLIEEFITDLDSTMGDSGFSSEKQDKAKKLLDLRLKNLCGDIRIGADKDTLLNDEKLIETAIEDWGRAMPVFSGTVEFVKAKRRMDSLILKNRDERVKTDSDIEYLRNCNSELLNRIEVLRLAVDDYNSRKNAFEVRAESGKTALAEMARSRDRLTLLISDSKKARELAEGQRAETAKEIELTRIEKGSKNSSVLKLEEDLKANENSIDKTSVCISESVEKARILQEQHQRAREEIGRLEERAAGMGENASRLRASFFDTYGRSLREFEERKRPDQSEKEGIRNRLNGIKERIRSFGQINHMAVDEFEQVKRQYEFLRTQTEDLETARRDLVKVIDEIRSRSQKMFIDTFESLKKSFNDMFRRLFGGGKALLVLLDPENVLESGIEIIAQPKGKTPKSLNLLSGGERSMTAVALLLATYQIKPSPFCILDEIDAALDDSNVGGFLSAVNDFSDKTQFIIVSHNKRTVMGSSSLLGVTQQEPGVSIVVTYHMESIEGEAAIVDSGGRRVELDLD